MTIYEHLRSLLAIPSPSWREDGVSAYIIDRMTECGYAFRDDECGNLLFWRSMDGPKPMLCCHMDTVERALEPHVLEDDEAFFTDGLTALGADDKAAIAAVLAAAEDRPDALFLFTRAEENAADAILPGQGLDRIMSESGTFLLEPDRALLKAGAFRLPCRRFAIAMLDRSTHFYITSSLNIPPSGQAPCSAGSDCISGSPIADNVSAAGSPRLQDFFRIFRIIRILPLDKNGIRTAGKDFPQADVTARNVPMGSDELRRRLKVQPSGRYHIFGLRVTVTPESESLPATSGNYLFITERL